MTLCHLYFSVPPAPHLFMFLLLPYAYHNVVGDCYLLRWLRRCQGRRWNNCVGGRADWLSNKELLILGLGLKDC